MSMFKIRLNLTRIKDSYVGLVNTPQGEKKCVIIPIEGAHMYLSNKGNCYLNATASTADKNNYGYTHVVKANIPFAEYRNLTAKQKERIPTIGEMSEIVFNNTNEPSRVEATPIEDKQFVKRVEVGEIKNNSIDTLPF